jgi:hypothetical protein
MHIKNLLRYMIVTHGAFAEIYLKPLDNKKF